MAVGPGFKGAPRTKAPGGRTTQRRPQPRGYGGVRPGPGGVTVLRWSTNPSLADGERPSQHFPSPAATRHLSPATSRARPRETSVQPGRRLAPRTRRGQGLGRVRAREGGGGSTGRKTSLPGQTPRPQVPFPPPEESDHTARERRDFPPGRSFAPWVSVTRALPRPERGGNRDEGEAAAVRWPGPLSPPSAQLAQGRTPRTRPRVCLLACCGGAAAVWATAGPGHVHSTTQRPSRETGTTR